MLQYVIKLYLLMLATEIFLNVYNQHNLESKVAHMDTQTAP